MAAGSGRMSNSSIRRPGIPLKSCSTHAPVSGAMSPESHAEQGSGTLRHGAGLARGHSVPVRMMLVWRMRV